MRGGAVVAKSSTQGGINNHDFADTAVDHGSSAVWQGSRKCHRGEAVLMVMSRACTMLPE